MFRRLVPLLVKVLLGDCFSQRFLVYFYFFVFRDALLSTACAYGRVRPICKLAGFFIAQGVAATEHIATHRMQGRHLWQGTRDAPAVSSKGRFSFPHEGLPFHTNCCGLFFPSFAFVKHCLRLVPKALLLRGREQNSGTRDRAFYLSALRPTAKPKKGESLHVNTGGDGWMIA